MLACLGPVRAKTADEDHGVQGGKTKPVPSRHGIKLFTFQLKQMAFRLTGGSLSKHCRPACTTSSKQGQPYENPAVHPSTDEMHSPQFSLKSYQMNGHTPTRQDQVVIPDNRFGARQASPKALRALHRSFADAATAEQDARTSVDPETPPGYKIMSNKWVAQVEPGVFITFCTAPDGFNDLKRIKFSRAIFSKQHAENWWTENCPRVRALYNVRPPSSSTTDDDRFSSGYATPDTYSKSPCSTYSGSDFQISRRKSSADSRLKEDSFSELPGVEEAGNSWVERDEAGVYLTIIAVPGVGKQLKRVRFSRDKFSEREAAAWWEDNRQRIYAQYVFTSTRLQSK